MDERAQTAIEFAIVLGSILAVGLLVAVNVINSFYGIFSDSILKESADKAVEARNSELTSNYFLCSIYLTERGSSITYRVGVCPPDAGARPFIAGLDANRIAARIVDLTKYDNVDVKFVTDPSNPVNLEKYCILGKQPGATVSGYQCIACDVRPDGNFVDANSASTLCRTGVVKLDS